MTPHTDHPETAVSADHETTIEFDGPIDVAGTLGTLGHGGRDLLQRRDATTVRRALRLGAAKATIELTPLSADLVRVRWWGSADHDPATVASSLLGAHDDPRRFEPESEPLRGLVRRNRGLRFPRDTSVVPTVAPAVFGQRVTSVEAKRGWRRLVADHGEAAPGPFGLMCAPSAERIASLPYFGLHPYGLDRRRAETLIRVCRLLARHGDDASTVERLRRERGVGPWTMSLVDRSVLGDPDAPIVGDYHIPHSVVFALTGRPRGDDAEMLELLEPFGGHRGRAQRLLARSTSAPRYGPKTRIQRIEHL